MTLKLDALLSAFLSGWSDFGIVLRTINFLLPGLISFRLFNLSYVQGLDERFLIKSDGLIQGLLCFDLLIHFPETRLESIAFLLMLFAHDPLRLWRGGWTRKKDEVRLTFLA